MILIIKAVLLLIAVICNVIFAFIVYKRRQERPYNIFYFWTVFFIIVWTLSHAILHTEIPVHTRILANLIYFAGTAIVTCFLMFCIIFHSSYKFTLTDKIVIFEPLILIGYLLFFTDTIIQESSATGQSFVFGAWYPIFIIHSFVN